MMFLRCSLVGPLGYANISLRASLALCSIPYSSLVSLGFTLELVVPSTFSPAMIRVDVKWLYIVSMSNSNQLSCSNPISTSFWNLYAIPASLSWLVLILLLLGLIVISGDGSICVTNGR